MNHRAILLFCLTLSIGCSACTDGSRSPPAEAERPAGRPQRRAERLPKGVELYCTRDEKSGQWLFGWLPGTNRLKNAEQVKGALRLAGIEKLKDELASFAPGEQVYFIDNNTPIKPRGIAITLPEKKVLEELRDFCSARQIDFICEGLTGGGSPQGSE